MTELKYANLKIFLKLRTERDLLTWRANEVLSLNSFFSLFRHRLFRIRSEY